MDEIYSQIWKLAKPYYEKGRFFDIEHVEWMMQDAWYICQEENIDETILLPLVILHDVGYGVGNHVFFEKDLKKEHMINGEKICREILGQLNYSQEKIDIVADYILIHDNWIYGENDIYTSDIVLGTFNDLDYMWMATPNGFVGVMKVLEKNENDMYDYIKNNDKPILRPFSTKTAKKLYEKYLEDRYEEIYNKNNN